MTNKLQQFARHGFNWWVNHETHKAQQKYGFDMTKHDIRIAIHIIMKRMHLNMHICRGF